MSLLRVGEWYKAPPEVVEVALQVEEEYGGNIAIGNYPDTGWCVLHDQGHGVGIVWKEK